MVLFSKSESSFARDVAELNYANPFTAERLELERRALGDAFETEPHPYWAMVRGAGDSTRGNVRQLTARTERLVGAVRQRIVEGRPSDDGEQALYDDLVLYLLFYQLFDNWRELYTGGDARDASKHWDMFSRQFDHWLLLPDIRLPSRDDKAHLFALFYQVFRAFFNIFDCVAGHSRAAARLRSQIWQSIFTHDLRRYRRSLYRSLHEVTTLVTGPSGSGKELVAQAIGRSRYIPYSVKERRFEASAVGSYIALNVSAFSANLIESELFGYIKGAFTGAEGNRAGWLETCGGCGTILLDEIGELPPMTQVKLLRVLQNRQYQRMGESKLREFHGKIVAATNRDLGQEIRKGTFREDLYYRLCADVVTTPALGEHLREDPATLGDLVRFITKRIAPDEHVQLTQEILQWIDQNLPPGYHWPGNIRELEQCARNIMIRNHYQPALPETESTPVDAAEQLARQIHQLELTADELLTQYARIAYAKTGSYKHAAERLGLDRRTLRARVTPSSPVSS